MKLCNFPWYHTDAQVSLCPITSDSKFDHLVKVALGLYLFLFELAGNLWVALHSVNVCCQQLSPHFFSRHPTLCLLSLWIWGLGNLFYIGCMIIHCRYIPFDGDIVSHLAPLFLEHFVTFGPRYSRFSWCFPCLRPGVSHFS